MSIESLVRPFTRIESAAFVQYVPAPLSDLEDLLPAYVAWGLPSRFISPAMQLENPLVVAVSPTASNANSLLGQMANRVTYLEQEGSIFDYSPSMELPETSRQTTTIRVYNPAEVEEFPDPEDRTMWVDVERIDAITFRGPDGEAWKFTLDHEGTGANYD